MDHWNQKPQEIHPLLILSWKASKLYRTIIGEAAPGYGLTLNEKDVLLFLSNNPSLDTAGNIVKYRSISKSLIAKSVKSLTERGLLTQKTDQSDARFVHLELTAAAQKIVQQLQKAQNHFLSILSDGISQEQSEAFAQALQKIQANVDRHSRST